MKDLGQRLLWLDMEMTGLDPQSCVPIEVAAIVTEADLSEVPGAVYQSVIHQPEGALANLAPIVLEMHTANGLLDKVRASDSSIASVDEELQTFTREYCEPGKALLSGNTIGQDRRFIRRYLPKFEECLHYRLLDVSSIKELVRRWYGPDKLFAKDSAHTALDDIRTSIDELRYYRKHFFLSKEGGPGPASDSE